MKKNKTTKPEAKPTAGKSDVNKGYPLYPSGDDIYRKNKEEKGLDPEEVLDHKKAHKPFSETEEDEIRELGEEIMGSDLDVPGSDLDDDQEDIGNEDEENNYYSIGGDAHNDLEEDNED